MPVIRIVNNAKRFSKETLHQLIGVPLTIAQSSVQRVQDLISVRVPEIRQQSKNAKMIGEFVVKIGSKKARDLLRKTPIKPDVVSDTSPSISDNVIDIEPVENYGVLSAPQIIALIETLDLEDVKAIYLFEQRNRKRRTVLAAAQAVLDR